MKLQPLLSEYLYANGSLSLQGTVQLKIQQAPAQIAADGTTFSAPASTIVFQANEKESPDDKLIDFIRHYLKISPEQAQELLKQNSLAQAIGEEGDNLTWPAVGVFSTSPDGDISFDPEDFSRQYLTDISLSPIKKATAPKANSIYEQPETEISEPIETEVPVEDEQAEIVAESRWWLGALIIFILSLLLIAYRYL